MKRFIYKVLKFISGDRNSAVAHTQKVLGHKYEIGEFTYGVPTIFDYGDGKTLKIGKFSSISVNVRIFLGGNHRSDWVTTFPFSSDPFIPIFPEAAHIKGHPISKGDVIIGSDVWVGHSATIMSGVTIADGAVVAAGALVTKNIGPYEIWGGNPAKFLKKRFTDEQIEKLLKIKWWNWDIDRVHKNVQLLCSDSIDQFIQNNENSPDQKK